MFNENAESNFSIYPNPANNIISVQTQIGATIVIFDAIGNQVASSKATNSKTDIAVDHLANGIYFVKVISDNHEQTQKLIISK